MEFNSHGFDKICKSWNIAIRTLLQLPFNAHTWLLGPIIEQNNIRTQLCLRNYSFLYYSNRSSNVIVKQCINHAMYNPSYSPTSHKSTQLPTIQQRSPF